MKKTLWIMMTALCVLFAPIAAEFYLINAQKGTATYAIFLSQMVSEEYAMGPGSGIEVMAPYWQTMPQLNQLILGVHALLASIVLIIGPFLLSRSFRKRNQKLHGKLGRIYFGLGIPAILLSVAYLLLTPMDRIYGGRPFAVGLWGIAILSLHTFAMGLFHITRGEVDQHQRIMILNFAAMLIAPFLRIWWLVLGRIFLGEDFNSQANSHVAVLMFLGLQTLIGAIIATHFLVRSDERPASQAIVRIRKKAAESVNKIAFFAFGLGILCGIGILNQCIFRFHGSFDIFSMFRPDDWMAKEKIVYTENSFYFQIHAISLCVMWIAFPGIIRAKSPKSRRRFIWIQCLTAMITCCGLIGMAIGFGFEGMRGWGSAIFYGTLASGLIILSIFLYSGLGVKNPRQVFEFSLHLQALSMTPVSIWILQGIFLLCGFEFEDAFLSAAVISTSLNLSFSHYHTVYASRSQQLNTENKRKNQLLSFDPKPISQ